MSEVYKKGPIELRLGDYRDVLADVEPSCVICDPPYGDRTHRGSDMLPGGRRAIGYVAWTTSDVREWAARWAGVDGWLLALTDDELRTAYRVAYDQHGRTSFASVPVLQHRPRLQGDGPGSGAVYAMVSRPRSATFIGWGSLPCWYMAPVERDGAPNGAKPLGLMRALVRDYSRPGDLVCDPCAGGATTLIAAALEGRRAIGAELDPETYAKSCARIERTALTPPLVGLDTERRPPPEQQGLGFGGGDAA